MNLLVIAFILACAFVFISYALKFRRINHASNTGDTFRHSLSWLMAFSTLAILMAVIAVLVAFGGVK